jgi:hypothetical protein
MHNNSIDIYRNNQLSDYLNNMINDSPPLYKCAGCWDEFLENEIELFKMHDLHDNKEMTYCLECIEYYKSENL